MCVKLRSESSQSTRSPPTLRAKKKVKYLASPDEYDEDEDEDEIEKQQSKSRKLTDDEFNDHLRRVKWVFFVSQLFTQS